ncbi:MAG TPA: alpha/beta hydrolase-fold protein [Humibacillus sp.]|nr:alpha/beta hydrolase-fold protein [Humibacillus sp.]
MGRTRITVTGTPVGEIDLALVTPHGSRRTEPLPLLLAHDGPEYARRAHLLQVLQDAHLAGRLPAVRVALLRPGPRNARYAANAHYAEALTEQVLPRVLTAYRTVGRPTIMGASLGALAALQAEWLRPGTFGGLFLQSGSFFRKRLDGEESFEHWHRVTSFVSQVARARRRRSDARIVLTCGSAEGNLRNNHLMARSLQRQGHDVGFSVVPGRHDWPSWRRGFDPHLIDLLALTTQPAPPPGGVATDGALPARIALVDRATGQ